MFPHQSAAIPYILQEIVEPRHMALIPAFLLEHRNVSKRLTRLAMSVSCAHPGIEILLLELFEMEHQFLVQLGIEFFLSEQRRQSLFKDAKESRDGHRVTCAVRRASATDLRQRKVCASFPVRGPVVSCRL